MPSLTHQSSHAELKLWPQRIILVPIRHRAEPDKLISWFSTHNPEGVFAVRPLTADLVPAAQAQQAEQAATRFHSMQQLLLNSHVVCFEFEPLIYQTKTCIDIKRRYQSAYWIFNSTPLPYAHHLRPRSTDPATGSLPIYKASGSLHTPWDYPTSTKPAPTPLSESSTSHATHQPDQFVPQSKWVPHA